MATLSLSTNFITNLGPAIIPDTIEDSGHIIGTDSNDIFALSGALLDFGQANDGSVGLELRAA